VLAGCAILATLLSGCTAQDAFDEQPDAELASSLAAGYGFRVEAKITGLDAPYGITVTPEDDFLYFTGGNGDASGIARVADGGGQVEWLDVDIREPGQIVADAAGVLYVVDRGAGRLLHSTDAGATWPEISAETGRFSSPEGVDARDGMIAVSNTGDDSVSISVDAGATWTSVSAEQGGFDGVAGVAIDSTGAIWVVDTTSAQLSVSSDRGATWTSMPGPGGYFPAPHGIAIGPHDAIWVTDPASGTVSRSDDRGETWFTGFGFRNPWGIAADADGRAFVTDDLDSIAELSALPAAPAEVVATWVDDSTVDIAWTPSAIDGGTPRTGASITAVPQLTEEQAKALYPGLIDLEAYYAALDAADAATDSGAPATVPSPTPSGALPPTGDWTVTVEGDATTARIGRLPAGGAVTVSVVVSNRAGDSSATTFTLPAR
jgi:hypothetical protein